MQRSFRSAVSAAALSLSLTAGAAFAQDELGLMQLQDSATNSMSQLNMDTSLVDSLTLDELAQIEAVAAGSDTDQIKVGRIDVILATAEERIAQGGSVIPQGAVGDVTNEDLEADMVLKANLQKNLNQAGITDVVDPETLSTEQLMQIESISGGAESVEDKRSAIQLILEN